MLRYVAAPSERRSVLAALRQRCLVGQAMALALWNAPAFAQNVITPDGRTQTNVAVSGSTTTITTKTISGGAGYNSFSRFEQGAGSTVNMHLPQNTGVLVNIVRDGPVVINGILNSYRNGQIGGHVYFSDSAGFTVGPSGVINTGRLTVNTPTREFLDQVIGPDGTVNETMAARLKANDVPISPDGKITIDGAINARRGVSLNGHSVSVAGQIKTNAAPVDIAERRERHRTAFSQSVNTAGLRHGAGMVARRGGGIEIVAAGTVVVSGQLSANATARRAAGTVTVRSGRGTTIAQTAKITAMGAAPAPLPAGTAPSTPVNTGDGGKVSITSDAAIAIARGATIDVSAAHGSAGKAGSAIVFAGTNLDVASGAVFRGVAGTSGDGGFLELSAKQTVTLGAVDVDLSARNGKAGLLYIDPTDIVIGTGGSANMITNGTNVLLEATNSITILGDGIIDTRNFNRSANGGALSAANPSLGNSGSITLEARQINVAGQLLAGVSPGSLYTAGDVTLSASASDRRNSGKATAEATIDVSGTITGRDVKLLADATGVSSFINPGPGIALFAGLTNLSILTGLNGGYVASDITARVSVKNGASITATRDIVISATGTQEATLPAVSVTAVSPLAAAVTYADLKARVTAEVESGASLTIGRNLTVEAKNEATLGATALAASAGQTLAAFAVAVGTTDIETKAIVSSGATVTVSSSASNVRVSAINENAFSTSATAMSISGGMVGLSVAYSDTKASAEARLGASLGSSSGRIGNVTVEAISDNSKNATSSAVTLGQNLIIESLQVANAMEVLFAPLTSRLGSREIGKFGSTLTLAKSDLSAIASIAADAGGAAPTIYATKAAVVSDVRDFALRAAADAGLSSNSKNPTAVNPEATVAMSAAIVYGDFRHTSRASIGAGVTVDANRIGVSATTAVPIANTWTDWGGFGETLSHLNGTFGVAGNILTSYASATAESSQLGLAGAVNYYKIANQTEAYVGPGATLRQNSGLGSWDIALGTGALQSFDKAVTVAASTKTETIDVAGNYGIFSGTGTSGGAGSAVGGAFADLQRESRTVAAVGAGVTITALELAVTAKTEDKIFVLAPTSGKAAGAFAANGMVVLVGLDNHTLASISNRATIDVTSIDVTARQFVSLFALTGAVTYGGANAIGVSVAALDTAGVTRAYIGDNSADLSGNRLGSGYAQGLVTTRSLDVEAVTDGRITVASIAAAISDPNASKLSFFKGIAAQGKTDAAVLRSGAGSSISLTAAGSAAVATTTLGTSAWIDGAVVVAKAGGAVITDVAATNATVAEVASGSAALNLTGASSPLSGALSGAVAIGLFDNSTDARIASTTITGAGDTIVQALAGGRQTVVGVSIAAARANSGAAAVSAAIGIITDSVSAQIRNSAINGISGASSGNDVLVNAYRATDIGIGGGAAYAGAQAGLGVALTYVSIGDPSGRDAVAALITDTSLSAVDKLTVAARTSSRIVSSAIAGGGGPDSNGLAGAIVITEISPTTRAAVTDTAGAPSRIAMDGDVLVVADSGKDGTLDAALDSRLANTDPGQIDFTGSATNANQAANPIGASIIAIAGAVQAGKNNIGSSFLSNTISQSHIALIENVDLTSSTGVTVRAQDGSLITAVAVGLGVATGQFAGVASVAQQTIDAVVTARISGGSIMSRDVAVQAQASSTIRGSAGSLGIGIGAAAVGLSIVESSIANDVAAEIDGTQIRASRDVMLTAGSTATIDTIAIGIALSRNVGLAGSVANNSVATDVGATITDADIIAGNNLGVFAANTDRITVSAGALGATAAAPGVAGGVSVVNNTIGGATTAAIEGSSVDARAGGTGSLSYDAGQLLTAFDLSTANGPSAAQPSLAMTARSVHGLGVIATSQQSVLANAVTGGVAAFPITGAVAIVPIRNVLGGSTSATIDSSLVDTRLTGTGSAAVAVEAASHSYAATFITVGAIGGVAASGANASNVMERSTRAALTNSTTGTTTPGYTGPGVTALDIAATSSQAAASNVIGFALGLGGAAAMGVVNSFNASTSASLDQGLVTAGRVGVTADSRNGFYARTVAVGVGGVGVGSAFIVGTSRNATLATIGGGSGQTVLNLSGSLAVAATSRNAFTTLASGGAAGGFAGVAGMVSFVDVDNETRAGLYGARVTIQPGATQTVGGVTSAAGISVAAHEATSITPTTAAGATGSIGAGAGANIASLDGLVQADIQGSTLVAPGTVSASATSERDVSALTVTYGVGGSAGIGAAVALISVGTGAPAGASGELTAGGSGTLSRIGQLTAGNADLVLSAAGLASYRSYRGAAGTAMSEGELREAARTDYNLLLANGTISGGAYTLTDAGVTALRSNAATALGIANPSDAQVRSWAATRYAAFSGGAVSYLLSDTGLSTYRSQVVATIPGASDDQVRSAANDAYARLLANGTVSGGVLTLSMAGLETYRAAANASLGRTATDSEIRNYAAQQYGFFTGNRSRIVAPAAQSAAALLESAGSATTASVSGGSIASGAVSVSALSRTTTTNTADGVGVGGGGVGAATAYTDVGDKVSARLDQISVTTGSIAVTANSTDGTGSAARVEATAGAGGLAAAAGAAVADGAISNQVTATLGGTLMVTGATSVSANNSQTSRSDAFGATVAGGLALGVSLATSSAESTVAARYANGSSLTGTGLTIGAQSTGAAHAAAVAGVGGLLVAGSGAAANATDSSNVSAVIGAGARANVGTGTISVTATASPDAKAAAFGVAVAGGLAVGVAVAKATVGTQVLAAIEGNASLIASQFTAGLLSVTATGSVFGTAAGDAVRLADSTSGFARGGYSAAASAVAGSGSYYVSATGTDARARNTSSVTASVGDYVRLPSGTVTITATNTTLQAAKATGITVGGTGAVGAVNAQADAATTTTASLGASSTMVGSGTGRFTLTAAGEDTQIVHTEAGTGGGLYAGSGATGSTSNTSDVTASIGANAVIQTGLATIGASHVARYASLVDSLQATALGASAALARNSANVDVLVSLGASSRITAAGPNTAGCYLTSCLQAISLTSRNVFTQLELGDSVRAAAGGGINGAGATSRTEIDGTSNVTLGNGTTLIAGTNPIAAPGPILVQAWTELTGNDTATLTTGGLLQGAGVSTRYRADVDNTVTLGDNVVLNSFGVINLGTYTIADVRANAYVSTYGLASVGLADADVTIRTDNKVLIGTNSELLGLYDVNVTAGRDGSGLRTNRLSGTATALGYVRGLIAVPDADASTNLQNHARVEVGSGTTISSAQNVTLGAYDGVLDADADGTGHGYQLYFIPVTSGSSSPGRSSTSTLVMNGTATAGIYNTQRVEIGCGVNASVQCGLNETPTIRFISGAPVTASYTTAFDPIAYINARYDAAVASTLISGVSSAPVKAVRLSQLYAAGGNVFVNASTVLGNGSLIANGGPSITVINRSAAYLVLDGGAYIPESTGGQIVGSSGSLTRQSNPDATPRIIIDNAYGGQLDASGNGPALLIAGDLTNLGGLVSINNTLGSFGFSGQRIDALQFNATVPNGAVAVSSNGPNGMYTPGASPQAEYGSYIYYPGGRPGSTSFNADEAVIAAANALAAGQGATDLNYFLYGRQSEGATRNFSLQFFGNCAGYIADSGYNCTGGYDMGNNIRFMVIPTVPTYRESNPVAQGGGTQIYGAQVAIKATTINVNASIEAGRITNWSGNIGGNVGDILRGSRQSWLDAGYTTVSLASIFGGGWSAAGAAPVSYDLVNDRLVMADVNASSGGGSVLLDGQIISTNTLGRIKINGGFGDVSVNNQSGLDFVVNRINTGTAAGVNASVSKITIVDRLVTSGANTTVYAYTPGSGIAVYKTHNGAQPTLSGVGASTPVAFISGDTTSYNPVTGTRYEWTQQAILQKEGLTEANRNQRDIPGVYWRFDSGTSGNPWVYVDAQSPSTNPGQDWGYWWSRSAQAPSATTVSGRLTNDTSLTNVGLTQEITGGQLDFIHNSASYGGCNGQAINHCDRDFVAQPGASQAQWAYNYATRAFVQVTASVKADNPFAVSFAGNAAGRVSITSNSSVIQQGNIVNPSGTTTIVASGGSFTQAPNTTILSNNLTLTARDSIGTQSAAIQATLTQGAQLDARTGSGGINLDITGSARVVALRADQNPGGYGNINVRATGSLEAVATGSTNVVGRNITLVSDEGSIGSLTNLMTMRAVATQLPNGSQVDGVVNLSARGDIGIAQVAGDLRVGQIESRAGDVRIDVAAGRLVSATGQTAAQALSADQLSKVSRALKLTAADGADAAALASITAFEKQVTQTYAQYSALLRNGSVTLVDTDGDGVKERVFTLNPAAIALYQAFADAELGRTAGTDEVAAYAARRYAAYSGVFESAYGGEWADQARFKPATLESNYSFSANGADVAPGLATRIAGDAVWTERQLVSAINTSALQPDPGVVGNGRALVIGHDVTLNTAGSIGSLAPDVQVALAAIRDGSVTNPQLAALAVATTPGTVKLIGQRQDGSLVEVTDLNHVPNGVTLIRVDVKQTAPLFINATGTFSASAQGDVYVQSTGAPNSAGGTLTIGHIAATGTVSLQAPQGIAVGTQADGTTPRSPVQIQTNGDLILVAGGGGIGSAATALTYQIGGRLVSASAAAGDAYLVAAAGNAEIGRIFASGTASLTARAGSIQGYLPGVAISASSIRLSATGNVGAATAALGLRVGSTGDVSATVGGSAWLSGPTVSGQTPSAFRIGDIAAVNGLNLVADGEIDILRSARSSAGAVSLTGARITMASGAEVSAAGRVSLASDSAIVLGRVASTLAAPAGGASIVLTATGAITGNGDSGALLDAHQAGGVISLMAGTGIGTESLALAFAAPKMSARSLNGGVYLSTAGATHATSLAADAGALTLSAGGNLTLDTVTSSSGARLSTSNGSLTLGTLVAGGDSSLAASGAVAIASATTTAGDLSVTSTGAGITATSVDAAEDATLAAATSISVTNGVTAGGAASVTASGGALDLGSLSAGASSALTASGAITLGSATTTAGDLSITSTSAGITATRIDVAEDATLAAATSISVTNDVTAGGVAGVTASGGTLGLGSLSAGASSTLTASSTITLDTATTTAGDLAITSTGAGITATSIDAAEDATLAAATSVSVTNGVTAGGAASVTASGGTLGLGSLNAGANSSLTASGAITLGTAATTAGDLSITSTGAGITANSVNSADDAMLAAATSVSVTNGVTAGGAASVTASGGTLDLGSLSAGASSSLTASGAITLGTATTTVGNLSIDSSGAGITASTINVAVDATLTAATLISVTNGLTAGGAANIAASGGSLAIDTLSAGASSFLSASGAIALGRAGTTAGGLSVISTGAGIVAATVNAAGSATLAAATSVSVTNGLSAGRGANLSANGGALAVDQLNAGATSTLTASGAIAIGSTRTTAGDLAMTSTGAGITAASIDAAEDATLGAAASISVTNGLTAGGTASVTANGGTLGINTLSAASAILSASDAVTLVSARTTAGDLSAHSIRAGITAATIDTAGTTTLRAATDLSISRLVAGASAQLSAGGSVVVGSLDAGHDLALVAGENLSIGTGRARAGAVSLISQRGDIRVDLLEGAGTVTNSALGSLAVGTVRSGTDILLQSLAGTIRSGTLTSGRDIGLQARGIVFDLVDAGRSASLLAEESIVGARVVASDALVLQAGRSGYGSITIETGAARSTNASADEVKLGRFGAGDSIVILGTRIAADIVQLPTGAGLPLMLDIAGFRERTAQSVDLRIDTDRFRIGRFESVDGMLTTTSNDFAIAEAFVPGALRVQTPIMTILANNRSLAPVPGYDVQLYQRDRGFSLTVNGKRLATSAFIVGLDSDVVDAPEGMHLGRDLARLGVLLSNGPSFGEIARGFVLGPDGRWRNTAGSDEPATTASTGAPPKPLVNLAGFEEQP
ncbi:leukotoxin LktA family filamentous adhesin [Bosea vestrisii]|uniref:leukotoxin LktA family filamentous adhesin n=1 Tax=Bosea vestrisii TaxID=151416 RepID=UPI0024DFF3A7|nr:leukotoxin LktA family filamentous adhesin [Bosea vestrisii]WID96648.1 leukotoxin LktA family filamentous adhesin [Bosea vestrisii]